MAAAGEKATYELEDAHERKQAAIARERATMTEDEILELMTLKAWKQADLALALGVAESTVWRWLGAKPRSAPIPVIAKIMRQWLTEARKQPKPARASA